MRCDNCRPKRVAGLTEMRFKKECKKYFEKLIEQIEGKNKNIIVIQRLRQILFNDFVYDFYATAILGLVIEIGEDNMAMLKKLKEVR